MRYGKKVLAQRPLHGGTLFLVTTIIFALLAIGMIVGRLWIS